MAFRHHQWSITSRGVGRVREAHARSPCSLLQLHSMTPQQFIAKWRAANLSERSACHQHFLDLCDILGQLAPAPAGSTHGVPERQLHLGPFVRTAPLLRHDSGGTKLRSIEHLLCVERGIGWFEVIVVILQSGFKARCPAELENIRLSRVLT